MPVYVDPLFDTSWADRAKWPYNQACHMMADTDEELHAMARKLGLKRSWHQMTSISHYDLTKTKRTQAVKLGAIEVDSGFRPNRSSK
jgi:hypothetical protein